MSKQASIINDDNIVMNARSQVALHVRSVCMLRQGEAVELTIYLDSATFAPIYRQLCV